MSSTPEDPERNLSPKPGKKTESKSDLSTDLGDLGSRIEAKQREYAKADNEVNTSKSAGIGQAMRLSSEFIAGICVGAGIGYMIDRFAGTSPWGLIVFLFLGFGAGVLNALRSAGLLAETNLHLGAGANKERDK